ncbi:phosphoribosylaminoimidazole carboxylase ade2 [Savitreella phatthalungensis]
MPDLNSRFQTVGVLGGGQLGRMLQQPASRIGVQLVFLDPDAHSPAKQIAASDKHVQGKFTDEAAIRQLAAKCDVLTIEIEHVNAEALRAIKKEGLVKAIYPDPDDIALIKDKYLQKEKMKHILGHDKVAEQYEVKSDRDSLLQLGDKIGFPYILKSRTDAYDGRGNFVVKSPDSIDSALATLKDRPLYGEKMVKFARELAVMVLRERDGTVHSYSCVETVHEDNICKTVFAPAEVPFEVAKQAKQIAEGAIRDAFVGAGIFGVELFHLDDGSVLLNEIAPRPHNSGHYTIEACTISQYEAHLRAVMGLPLPKGFQRQNCPAIMYNLLGAQDAGYIDRVYDVALELPRAAIHLYGKAESRPARKMGHITITGATMADCRHGLKSLEDVQPSQDPLPVKVAVIMGSDSDGPSMKDACDILEEFGVGYEKEVVSAHRTPTKMYTYAQEARSRGIQVIIAAAGGAAHLPGMVAALTSLPVIGVPVNATCLDGMDSLLSQVQMPRGIPVATVAIGNSTNAALLAIRMLGIGDAERFRQIETRMEHNRQTVERKNETFRVVTTDRDPFADQDTEKNSKAHKGVVAAIKERIA